MPIEISELALQAVANRAGDNAFALMLVKNLRNNQAVKGESHLSTDFYRRNAAELLPGIDIDAFTWGIHRAGVNAANRQHRAQPDSLIVCKLPDASTAAFTQIINSGDPLSIVISMFKERGATVSANERTFSWLSLGFEDAVLVRQNIALPPGSRTPVETLELSYQRLVVKHHVQGEDGNPGPATETRLTFNAQGH